MMHKPILALTAFAATSLFTAAAGAQPLEATYRGMFVCEQFQGSPDILHVPLDLAVRGGNVQFARPLFNWNGTRVLGSELGSGTVDSDGKLHLTSEWDARGVTFQGNYNGTLTPTGGTVTGTQSWRGPEGKNGSRTCTAAFVTAPQARHTAAE